MSFINHINNHLESHIKAGTVKVENLESEIKVTVSTPSEFEESNAYPKYSGSYHQRMVKNFLKEQGFSFTGTNVHFYKKKVFNNSSQIIKLDDSDICELNYFTKIKIKGMRNEDGDIEYDKLKKEIEDAIEELNKDLKILESIKNEQQ